MHFNILLYINVNILIFFFRKREKKKNRSMEYWKCRLCNKWVGFGNLEKREKTSGGKWAHLEICMKHGAWNCARSMRCTQSKNFLFRSDPLNSFGFTFPVITNNNYYTMWFSTFAYWGLPTWLTPYKDNKTSRSSQH